MIKIFFNQHQGELEIDTNVVKFYGLYFQTMNDAVHMLTNIDPGEYEPYYLRGSKGFIDVSGKIFLQDTWWDNEETILKVFFHLKNNYGTQSN